MKKIVIPWSGGLDSTLLVLDALTKGYSVKTFYVDLVNNSNQCKRELQVRKEIKKLFRSLFDYNDRDDLVVKAEIDIPDRYPRYLLVPYLLWNFAISIRLTDFDEIHLPFIQSDTFWHFKSEAIDFLKSTTILVWSKRLMDSKIRFPLEWCTKRDVLKLFKEKHFGFLIKKCFSSCDGKLKNIENCQCCKCKELKDALESLRWGRTFRQ